MVDSYRYSSGVRTVDNLQEADGDEERHFMLAMGIESFVSCAYYDYDVPLYDLQVVDLHNYIADNCVLMCYMQNSNPSRIKSLV